MNGQEPRKNVNFFGPDHGDSSDSDENRHHTQNAKSHFDLRGDASVNNDGLHSMSLEDQFMRQEHQATAIQMQQMGLGLAQNTEKQWACCLQ